MIEYLFIRPTLTENEDYLWYSYDFESGNVLASGYTSSLEDLARINKSMPTRSVVVLYPSTNITFRQIEYPKKITKALHAAILYMFEDEFAEEVDELDLRVLKRNNNVYDIAIYRKNMIEDLEEALIELGFNVISIIPDVLTLPTNMSENDKSIISLLNIKNEWLVRVGMYKGYVLNKDILDFGLQQIQKDLNEEVKVLSLSPLPDDLSATYEEELSESVYALMAEGALSSSVNFSTQSSVYSSKLFNKELFKGWIKVIIILVITFIIWFVNVCLDINKVNKEISSYKASQRQLISSIFGSKLDVNNMLQDFNNRLDFIESVDLHNSFLNVSRALHSRIIRENGVMIKSFSYDNDSQEFEIEFETAQEYKVNSLKAQLIDMFTVEQIKSSNKDKITVYVWRIRKIADE